MNSIGEELLQVSTECCIAVVYIWSWCRFSGSLFHSILLRIGEKIYWAQYISFRDPRLGIVMYSIYVCMYIKYYSISSYLHCYIQYCSSLIFTQYIHTYIHSFRSTRTILLSNYSMTQEKRRNFRELCLRYSIFLL